MAIYRRKGKDKVPFGSYRISVYKGIENGKKIYHVETFDGRIQDARKRETEIKGDMLSGKYVKPSKLTLGEYLDKWLNDYSAINTAPSTHRVYKQQVNNHVKPAIGNLPLNAVTPAIMSDYYANRIKAGLSGQTVTHHRTMLHKAFKTAKQWGLLAVNPVDDSTPIKITKPEMQTYEAPEVSKYLEAAKKTDYYALFHLGLHTGLSRSELLGLKWQDVSLDILNPTIKVVRSLHEKEGGGYYLKEPKTASRRRLVVLTPASAVVLQAHYDYCKATREALEKKLTDDMFCFCHLDTGEPYRPGYISHLWGKIAKDAGLKHIRLHDSRHSHATILLEQGVHPKIVQERLGHSSIDVTMDIYSHVTQTMQASAAKRFDEVIKPKEKEETKEG